MHNFVILNASCFFIILSFLVNYNEKIFFSFLLELKIKNNIYITTTIITTKANRKKMK
jgi:hypothetical protein